MTDKQDDAVSQPGEVRSSAQLGPVAEVRDGLLSLHIPSDDYSLPTRFLHGVHLLYEVGSKAAADVLAERHRQIDAEGWTPEHDDEHEVGQMAHAAACYTLADLEVFVDTPPAFWPWGAEWWKPKDRRSNLVRAAALLLAEIERLDRAA